MLQAVKEVNTKFGRRRLPRYCPCCGVRLVWGWDEEEFSAPCEAGAVYLHRLPRPDQTVFCPCCEEAIQN